MNILVIDNNTRHLPRLLKALSPHEVHVVPFKEITPKTAHGFNAIVLSGGRTLSIRKHPGSYASEIALLRSTRLPVLGICLGFELLCHAYGERLIKMKQRTTGPLLIRLMGKDRILKNVPQTFRAIESHRFAVRRLHKLKPLGNSTIGIEICRHPSKPLYGVQFHPEALGKGTQGHLILRNFLRIARPRP